MPKHVVKKLYRELEIFVNTVIVTKLWQCYKIDSIETLLKQMLYTFSED